MEEPGDPQDAAAWILRVLRGEAAPFAALADEDFAYAVTATANDQGVLPLLHEEVGRRGRWDALPPNVQHVWQEGARAAATTDLRRQAAVEAAFECLNDAGIEFLVLKGAVVGPLLYPRPHVRIRSDTDLLFPDRETTDAAAAALAPLGYARWPAIDGQLIIAEYPVCRPEAEGGFCFDLHWRLSNSRRLSRSLSFRQLRRDAQLVPGRIPVYGPSLPHLLLHACLHRLGHATTGGENRWIWLYDIHLMVGRLVHADWRAFIDACDDGGVAGIALSGLGAARDHFGSSAPPAVLDELTELASRAPVVMADDETPLGYEISELRAIDDWRVRLRYLKEHLFPDPEYMMQRDGLASRAQLPLAYARRIVRGLRRRWR